jgi:hypothetical protein
MFDWKIFDWKMFGWKMFVLEDLTDGRRPCRPTPLFAGWMIGQ